MLSWEPYPRPYTSMVPCKTIKVKVKKYKKRREKVNYRLLTTLSLPKNNLGQFFIFFNFLATISKTINIHGLAYGCQENHDFTIFLRSFKKHEKNLTVFTRPLVSRKCHFWRFVIMTFDMIAKNCIKKIILKKDIFVIFFI